MRFWVVISKHQLIRYILMQKVTEVFAFFVLSVLILFRNENLCIVMLCLVPNDEIYSAAEAIQ